MNADRNNRRLPHSIRKRIRLEKARLRRELPAAEAKRAIEQLVRRYRRGGEPTPATPAEQGE
ncbi:MAG TPA: hypothetical protein VFG08_07090 [Candidatus Polarisedimenticolia bacterium]|nr:hypothetical protein [Candidatus Polarisedimenticolia bacterium]